MTSLLDRKSILITGATGFVGKRLAERFHKEGQKNLLLLTRNSILPHVDNVKVVTSSLDKLTKEIWKKEGIERIDIVFHLGAFTPKSTAEIDSNEEIFRDNLIGTKRLLDSLPAPPEKIIYASTLDVYGEPRGAAITEDSPIDPVSLYGASKFFCEQLVRAYAKRVGSNFAIIRYGHIYGPGEERYRKFLPETIRKLLKGETVLLYGDGSVKRDFLYIDDAVEATVRAAVHSDCDPGPLNIVSGVSVSLKEVIDILMTVTGNKSQLSFDMDRPSGYSLHFDSKRMVECLGNWDMVPLEEGLKNEVDYFREIDK